MKFNFFSPTKGKKGFIAPLLLGFLLVFSCQNDFVSDLPTNARTENATLSVQNENTLVTNVALPENITVKPDIQAILDQNHRLSHLKEFVKNAAINPDDYECGPTEFDDYINGTLAGFTFEQFDLLINFGFDIPFLEAYFYDTDEDEDYFGPEGRFTSSIRKDYLTIKRFWEIPTDVQLSDMHGTVFQDVDLVAQILSDFYGSFDEQGNFRPLTREEAYGFANFLKEGFSDDVFQDYNHPLFSFNAFSVYFQNPDGSFFKKIVMGDGIMQMFREIGLGTLAASYVLAHEYGHQVQSYYDYFPLAYVIPEETRALELEADAYGAYTMLHRKGLFARVGTFRNFYRAAFGIGDCGFQSPSHHGTPNQRSAAVEFALELATPKSLINTPLTGEEFHVKFLEVLPELTEPDAIVEEGE